MKGVLIILMVVMGRIYQYVNKYFSVVILLVNNQAEFYIMLSRKQKIKIMTNREIKFRAWDDGEMIYSHNNTINDDNFQLVWFFNKVREDAILMQYIDVNDCNDKEIFTGDIVKWGHRKNSEEIWHRYAVVEINPDLQLKVIYYKVAETGEIKPTDNHIFHWGRFSYGGSDLEVIGNIYENANLLNKKPPK